MTKKNVHFTFKANDCNTILDNIKKIRLSKNISSKYMACELKIKPYEYSKIENGKILNINKYIDEIARILGVDKFALSFKNEDMYKCFQYNQQIVDIINLQQYNFVNMQKSLEELEIVKNNEIQKLNDELVIKTAKINELQDKLKALSIHPRSSTNSVFAEREHKKTICV